MPFDEPTPNRPLPGAPPPGFYEETPTVEEIDIPPRKEGPINPPPWVKRIGPNKPQPIGPN